MTDAIHNPGGYRPDDPRYGLSGQALQDYYLNRPNQFFIRCRFAPDAPPPGAPARDAHRAHIATHRERLWFAGPLLSDDGGAALGVMYLFEASDTADAEAFLAGDGYARADLFAEVEMRRFVDSKPVRQRDRAPDPALQMFVCECLDGPDAPALRQASAAAHHRYQGALLDRYVAHGPLRTDDGLATIGSLFIIEVADRAAAEALVAAEPMMAAGVFETVRITRWRYGDSLTADA